MAGIFPDGGTTAGQSLGADPSIGNDDLVNCEGGALFNPTNRCPSRFDPKSANAVISEIINLVLCSGNKYDCSKYDNLCEAVSRMINESLFACLSQNFPSAENACSIEQLVMTTSSDGCRRIARYSASSAEIGFANQSSVWGLSYGPTLHPTNPNDPNTYYTYTALNNDVQNGTVNAAKLTPNHFIRMNFTATCDGSLFDAILDSNLGFNPAANSGAGASSRFVYRLDGQFPVDSAGQVRGWPAFTNFENEISQTTRLVPVSAGNHTIDVYIVGMTQPPAQAFVLGDPVRTGQRLTLRRAVA